LFQEFRIRSGLEKFYGNIGEYKFEKSANNPFGKCLVQTGAQVFTLPLSWYKTLNSKYCCCCCCCCQHLV